MSEIATDVVRRNDAASAAAQEQAAAPAVDAHTVVNMPVDGNMGLRGIWSNIGNMTFVGLVASLFAWLIAVENPRQQREAQRYGAEAHKETMDRMERITELERRMFSGVIERNTTAIEKLTEEVRGLRHTRESK